jgi:hypothetical protein
MITVVPNLLSKPSTPTSCCKIKEDVVESTALKTSSKSMIGARE